MSASLADAHPWGIYGARLRVLFPILDADGDPVTAAATLDSEFSLDQAAFADCTAEATEIGSSGIYYLDLDNDEMLGKQVTIRVQTSTSGAKTTILTIPIHRLPVVASGTLSAGAAGSFTLPSAGFTDLPDDYFNGYLIRATNNSPAGILGEMRRIIDYVGSTRVGTPDFNWNTAPDGTTTFEILPIPELAIPPQQMVDAWLFRSLAGAANAAGSEARNLQSALRAIRNRWTNSAGTLTVYAENDSTSAWTAATTATAGNPLTEVNPT